MGYRIRGAGRDPSMYKWGDRPRKGSGLHKGNLQFRGRINPVEIPDLPAPSSQGPGSLHTPCCPSGRRGLVVEQHGGRGCSRTKRNASNRVQDLGEHPCPSRITLPTPILKAGSLPRVPINVATQSDLGLWLDLSFRGRMLQDHRARLNPCSRGHGCTVRGRASVGGQREGGQAENDGTWRV